MPYRKCVGAVLPGECRSVSRRGIWDRAIWRKPLAFVADAGELWVLLGRFDDPSPWGMERQIG